MRNDKTISPNLRQARFVLVPGLASLFATFATIGCGDDASTCPDLAAQALLVSGYTSNQVHRYDACGGYLADVDDANRIRGAQATRVGPDGRLYVASEENGRILRYDADTLAFIDVFIDGRSSTTALAGIERPTALAFDDEDRLYVGGYDSNRVARIDMNTGRVSQTYTLRPQLEGLDAGIAFGPDGRLYVPGYDSNNILAIDPETSDVSVFVASETNALNNPRVIVFDVAQARMLVSNEGSSRVMVFDLNGQSQGPLVTVASPTGLAVDRNGHILVASDNFDGVRVFTANGEAMGTLVERGSGGLRGATFLTLIDE